MAEQIVLQGLCNQVKGAIVENGHGMLTNQRFIYSKHSLAPYRCYGCFRKSPRGDFDFDIPLADITEVRRNQKALFKNSRNSYEGCRISLFLYQAGGMENCLCQCPGR